MSVMFKSSSTGLLMLFCAFRSIQAQVIRSNQIEKTFKAVKGMYLSGHVISTHHVTCPMDCSFLCTANTQSKSYNYKPKRSGEDKDLCQLSNTTRVTNPGSYKPDSEYVYYYKEPEIYKSCLDYLRNGASQNGIYSITDASGDSYHVFCDLNSEPRSAWTLILSFAFKNRKLSSFCTVPLSTNAPVNEDSPNWEAYRLSLRRMQRVSQQSTHVRFTTGFAKYGNDFKDYLRAKLSELDIFSSYNTIACKKVEYVSLREHKSQDVTVRFVQYTRYIFHLDSYNKGCQFDASAGSSLSENNFGLYCTYYNAKFRGCMDDDSTTEYWFGGSLT